MVLKLFSSFWNLNLGWTPPLLGAPRRHLCVLNLSITMYTARGILWKQTCIQIRMSKTSLKTIHGRWPIFRHSNDTSRDKQAKIHSAVLLNTNRTWIVFTVWSYITVNRIFNINHSLRYKDAQNREVTRLASEKEHLTTNVTSVPIGWYRSRHDNLHLSNLGPLGY